MSQDKIKDIQEWPTPTTVKEVLAFLGFLNFNRRFVAGFSKKALPLIRLTAKDTEFNWGKEQDDAVKQLKEACMNPPVLVTF